MFDLESLKAAPHHPAMGELVDLLCHRTGNVNRDFFQAEVAYFLGLIPSAMRATIISPERGKIPVNIYSIALATSGFGKGHSVSLMEDVISDFRDTFAKTVFPFIADKSLFDLAVEIAAAKGGDESKEKELLDADFKRQGHAPFIFDSGTGPAVKQLRYKLLLARAGAINFQMDEIGSNLVGNTEIINILLELYDLGRIKTKLVKNTVDNERGIDLMGTTPANILMFGTTSKLFDGSKTEEEFYSFLEMGYARRCFFGMGRAETHPPTINPEDVYNGLVSKNRSQALLNWKRTLNSFADPKYYNRKLDVPKDVGVKLISYRLMCEGLANQMPEHDVLRKAEMSHRYFKGLKLAGVYAFLDDSPEITMKNLMQALKVCEESGASFQTLLKRERNFVRLAKYIAESSGTLTHADLVEDLPYYPTSGTPRREIMDLAMAWGVGNHVVIKKTVVSGVEFFSGTTLQETDLNKIQFSFSDNFASGYSEEARPFDKLPRMLTAPGFHWCNHYFDKEHRSEENVIEGFNCLVVDVDGSIQLDKVHELMKDYTFITATTKRHTDKQNRFRLIMPTNYNLSLDKADYREFMNSFLLWLPFESDDSANQRSKKWMTNPDSIVTLHRGPNLVNVLPFIPKTKQNSEYRTSILDLGRLNHLERWFLNNMDVGNRNNNLLNFAMMLKDAGMAYDELASKVHSLNEQSVAPLKKDEVVSTVLKSVAAKYAKA
jgi:Primase C terminal 1 (PriCT-1)